MTAKKAAKPAPAPKAKGGKPRKADAPQPTGTLTEACARVLGAAHEPLTVADVTSKLLAGGWRKTEYQVGVELAAMVPAHASRHGEKFWTPADAEDVQHRKGDMRRTAEGALPPSELLSAAPTLPVKSLAELIAEAPRKVKRTMVDLTDSVCVGLEAERATRAGELDAAVKLVKATTARINLITRMLRTGKFAREVSTVTVPDRARALLVTFDVTSETPVEVSSKKLPRKYGAAPAEQMALNLGGGK